ncbi:MAG: PIN domain-containing protein [Desulfuromusa sp.]|nr:PIN domain-containing protein [Desulfuromusa sp.]
MIYLDTHVVAWLYAGLAEKISPKATKLINANPLYISPMVQLELEYLNEIGRISVGSAIIVETLSISVGLELCKLPFFQIITEAVTETWTRDPFDRIIVAHAKAQKAVLLTKDNSILKNYPLATW